MKKLYNSASAENDATQCLWLDQNGDVWSQPLIDPFNNFSLLLISYLWKIQRKMVSFFNSSPSLSLASLSVWMLRIISYFCSFFVIHNVENLRTIFIQISCISLCISLCEFWESFRTSSFSLLKSKQAYPTESQTPLDEMDPIYGCFRKEKLAGKNSNLDLFILSSSFTKFSPGKRWKCMNCAMIYLC